MHHLFVVLTPLPTIKGQLNIVHNMVFSYFLIPIWEAQLNLSLW